MLCDQKESTEDEREGVRHGGGGREKREERRQAKGMTLLPSERNCSGAQVLGKDFGLAMLPLSGFFTSSSGKTPLKCMEVCVFSPRVSASL